MTGFWVFRSVDMANSGGEDEDWGEGSGDEEEREEGDDDLIEVHPSGSRDSVKPILRLPERNEEDTTWTRADGTKPASAKNKLKSEDMATICKRKDLRYLLKSRKHWDLESLELPRQVFLSLRRLIFQKTLAHNLLFQYG